MPFGGYIENRTRSLGTYACGLDISPHFSMEDFLTREYTLVCDDVVHAGSLLVHRNELIFNIRKSTGQMLGSIAMFRVGLEPTAAEDSSPTALPSET